MGNTIPPLVSSFTRILLMAIPLLVLAGRPGFALWWIWYLSVATVAIRMVLNLLLLRREFRLRLAFTDVGV